MRDCADCIRLTIFWVSIAAAQSLSGVHAAESGRSLGPAQDVSFVSRHDGSLQHYVIRVPDGLTADDPSSVLIALHGHGSDRWQFASAERAECQAARDAAAQYRMIYISPDYRAPTSWMGPAAAADVRQVIDILHHQFRIQKVIVCGGSMGGTSALAFATLHPEIVDGVISWNGTANLLEFTGFSEAIAASYGGTRIDCPEVYRDRSAELFPARLTMPVGLTTGGNDHVVPPDSSLRLAELLAERKTPLKLIHQPMGGHETSYEDAMATLNFVLSQSLISKGPSVSAMSLPAGPSTVVCLGDSVTGVYYHTGGRRAYPEMLEIALQTVLKRHDIQVINAGISGQTTKDGLKRLESDVLDKSPQIVTISFGLNDLTRISPEEFRQNLVQLVNRCRERQCDVILCTPNAVIDTPDRPVEKLAVYCEIIRTVGRELSVRVCDQFYAGTVLKDRAPWTWRTTLSDEIHPNMDGHKRMAEELCRTITGKTVSLESLGPPRPPLQRVRSQLASQRPIKILAMPPYDQVAAQAIKKLHAGSEVGITTWSTEGKSIAALEEEARTLARNLKPDLVIVAVPRGAAEAANEHFVKCFSWIMNWSLSFGTQEWDCVVVHPSVAAPGSEGATDELYRQLVHAQDLDLIDRDADDQSSTAEIFTRWLTNALTDETP